MHELADLGRGSFPYVWESGLYSSLDLDLDLVNYQN